MKLSLRAKTVLLLTALTLGPVAGTALLLINANSRPVHDAEEQLQSAVVNEVAEEPLRPLHEVQKDVVAVAAVLSRAVEGKIHDDDAIESVRALIGSRERISAVRFEVPAAKVSTVIRWATSDRGGPRVHARAARPRRRRAGIAVSVAGPSRGLVVARIKAPAESKAPAGYVTVRADLDRLARVARGDRAATLRRQRQPLLATA